MRRRLSILMALVFLFTAVIGASFGAVYAAEDDGRIRGADRYVTACEIAKQKYSSADTVIIVRGDSDVVDGLTASVLAGAKDAPILFTRKDSLPDVVKKTIEDLGVKNVYIIGGTAAVSEAVEEALKGLDVNVERVKGGKRYETAVEVAKKANTGKKTAIVTQGFAPADALVAGPLAVVKGYPILLVEKDKVGAAAEAAIKDLGIENIIIVGGEAVVSEKVEEDLRNLVSGRVARLKGGDRVLTSIEVAKQLDANEVVLVNGWNFVDAVPASVLGLPILYVKKDDIRDEVLDYVGTKAGVKIIGGTNAISDAVANKALNAVELKIVSVSAVGAKKIEVVFNKAVDRDKAVFEVRRGAVKPSIKSITFAEDNKSAVIEFNIALVTGDYTVKVTGLRDEALTAEAKIEAAKLTTIEFTSDVAVISHVTKSGIADKVKVGVVARNQYGEEISTFSPSVSASKGTMESFASNVLTLTYASGYTVGEKIVVTIVDPSTGVSASKTLTVAQAAQVASIKIGELKTDDANLAAKPINVSNLNSNLSEYYIPVEIKDQYGNILKAADLVGVGILSSNRSIINPDKFEDYNGTTVIKLKAAEGTPTSGTAVITIVAAGTGVTASTTVTVLPNATIDVIYLSAPETELKLTKAAVLPVTVVDTYGEELDLKDVTITPDGSSKLVLNGNSSIEATNATLNVKVNYVTGEKTIEITPTDRNVIVTATTSTGKFQNLNLVALDKPVPTSIKGMKSDFKSILVNDTSMDTTFQNNVVLLDQYGDEIGLESGYTLSVSKKDGSSTTFDPKVDPWKVTATTNTGKDVYVVTLKDNNNNIKDEFEVTITVIDKDKITKFEIEDPGKLYTGDDFRWSGGDTTVYDRDIVVYGVVDGKKVEIPQSMVTKIWYNKPLAISSTAPYKYTADPDTKVNTEDKDEIVTITALVEAGDETYTITKDIVYSSAAPTAQSLAFMKNNEEVTVVEISKDSLNGYNLYTGDVFKVVVKDQYNVELKAKNVTFFVTSKKTEDSTVDITINNTTGQIEVTNHSKLVGGDSFQINAYIGGLYKSVKVVVTD